METVLVYKASDDKRQSIEETLRDNGYITLFADNILDFIRYTGESKINRVCIYINDISDVRILHTIGNINKKINIMLLVEKNIQDIIELYKNTNYTMLSNVSVGNTAEKESEAVNFHNNGQTETEKDVSY